jgi:hypothetical protein
VGGWHKRAPCRWGESNSSVRIGWKSRGLLVPVFAAMKIGRTTMTIVAMEIMLHPDNIVAWIAVGLIAGRLT